MAGTRTSNSDLSLKELMLKKEGIESEIKARIQYQQLSTHGIFVNGSPLSSVQTKVNQLLQYIIYGNQNEAERILKNNLGILSELLTWKAEVVDYSGRKILGTALQLAMGAKDVSYHVNEERMVEMLMKYYRKLHDGESIIAVQIAEQFPDGFEKAEEERRRRDNDALRKVIDAIANSNNDKQRDYAINDFVDYLKTQIDKTITSGYHFNDQLLQQAFRLYDQNHERFGGYKSIKNLYCWRKVLGNIERYLPACDAQAFCQGIYNIVVENEPLARSLIFKYDIHRIAFYPLESNPYNQLGSETAAGFRGSWRAHNGGGDGRFCWYEMMWKEFSIPKRATMQRYIHQQRDLVQGPRVVM